MNGEYIFYYAFTVLVAVLVFAALRYLTKHLGDGNSLISLLWGILLVSAIIFWWNVSKNTYADEHAINMLVLWMEGYIG